jgi:cell shape-determining protein MreD
MFYLPTASPVTATVLAGIILDLHQGAPLGYSASVLLLTLIIVILRRPVWTHFDAAKIWYEFALIMLMVQIYCFAVITLWSGHTPSIGSFVFQYGITVLLFPVMNWAFALFKYFNLLEGSP